MEIRKYFGTGSNVFVVGNQFGPCLLAIDSDIQETIDEYDERFGDRVNPEDSALKDYEGETLDDRITSAMESGDIRINDGGTMVWVDPYEWVKEFPTEAAAIAWIREWSRSPIEIEE